MKLKTHVREMICAGAKWSGVLALAHRRMARSLTVLAYHRVLPDAQRGDYPLPSLVTPTSVFREQMRWLAANCEVLPLSAAMKKYSDGGGRAARPIVAVTFDDGYADNVDAARVLEGFGARGTFFVTTSFINGDGPLWFDRAAFAWRDAPAAVRATLGLRLGLDRVADARKFVQRLKGCEPGMREAIVAELERACGGGAAVRSCGGTTQAAMSLDDVAGLHRRGHEIGSHTETHPILPQLSEDRLWAELHESRRFLEDLLGEEVRSLAYPNGDHDARVMDFAAAAGYRIAATTAAGVNTRRVDPLRLRRIDVSREDAGGRGSAGFRTTIALRGMKPRSSKVMRGIAYLNSHYPSVSHTFIEREIAALRARGARVVPFSVRPTASNDRIGEAHARAAEETVALLDRPWRLVRVAAAQMLRHPLRAVRAIVEGQRLSPPGLRVRARHFAYAFEGARLAREMRSAGVSHVHVHMANNGAMVARLACVHDPSIEYSMSIHGSAEFFNVDGLALRAKSERAMFVRCISDFCRAQVMAWAKPSAWERFHVVRCGIDPGPEPRRIQRSALRDQRILRLVTVGRLHPIKGYGVLLRACGMLTQRGIEWSLDMIGEGPERSRLEGLARELGIHHRVRFRGAVAAEDVAAHYEAADLMVMSSFMEGVPIVLMEAMARGLPVVATRVGGVAELVEDGVSGLLVAPGSETQLTDAIGELATAGQRRADMGRAGRERVVQTYNRHRLGEEMFDLFQRYGLLHAPRRAPQAPPSTQRPASRAPRLPRRYVLVSPCRNEAAFMRETLDSVLGQTARPDLWIIVDDGSTDESPEILKDYAAKHDFIQVVRVKDRGRRSVGPGVVDAVNAGLDAVALDEFDYLCKLDLDLRLPAHYFETLLARMEAEPRLGTCSGKPYFLDGRGRLVSEMIGDDVSAGMTKFYRVACFRDIGGFVREVMWDGIDCHRCRMNGWRARSWDEPDLRFLHLRPMGSSQRSQVLGGYALANIWTGRFRHGYGQWFMGTSPVYMTASAMFRMSRPPLVLGGVAMLCGYFTGMARGLPRYPDVEFRRFLRLFQRLALLHGKNRAVNMIESRTAPRLVAPLNR